MNSGGISDDRPAADRTISFGYLLRRLRKARDLTQEAMARLAGCTPDTIHKIETDQRRPSLSLAGRLADILALSGEDRSAFVGAARSRLSPDRIALPTMPALPSVGGAPRPALPPQTTAFVGREAELAALDALLADPATRLVTVCGLGGVGKTRLALAAAERQLGRVAAGEIPYADGVFFVALAGISTAAQLTSAVANGLGLILEPGPRSQRRQLLDYLRHRHLLLMLDNYDQLVDDVGLLADIVETAPFVTLVVTSRERLLLHFEQVLALDGLAVPATDESADAAGHDAVELFLRAAQRAAPDFSPGPDDMARIVAICRLVEGLPLAIELAAAWIALLSPAVILEELRQGLTLLTTELRDVPARQRSVRAVCEAAWERLSPPERSAFMRLSCFRGGFTLEAAREVAQADLPVLAHLVNRSLIRRSHDRGRYGIHELLRQYAAERIGGGEPARELHARHAGYYCRLLARHAAALTGPAQLVAAQTLKAEDENLHVAWAHALAAGLAPLVDLAADGLGTYYEWQGYLHEGEAAFHAAELWAGGDSAASLRLQGRLAAWHGVFCTLATSPAAAAGLFERSLELLGAGAARDEDVRAELAFSLWRLGRLRALQGHGEAMALFERSLELYRELGRDWETSSVLSDLGELQFTQGLPEAASRSLGESQLLCEGLGDLRGLAQTLQRRSRACFEVDQLGEAELLARRSSELARALGSRSSAAAALARLGLVLMHSDRYAEAGEFLEQSLGLYERLGDRPMTAMAHNRLALALLHLGAFEAAYGHAQLGVALAREPGGLALAQALLVLAVAEKATGDLAAADAACDEGLRICAGRTVVSTSGPILGEQSGVAWERGDGRRARALAVEALRLAIEQRNLITLSVVLPACILPLVAEGRAELAAELYGLDAQRSLWRTSRLVSPYRERLLAGLGAALPPDALAAAVERGRGLEQWGAARALLRELEALGWSSETAEKLGSRP